MARSTRSARSCVGAIAGAVCAVAIGLKYKMGLDDSLDVVGVHLTGGIIGALLIGFFGTRKSPQGKDGLFPSGGGRPLLRRQRDAAVAPVPRCACSRSSGAACSPAIIGLAIKYTIGWRITPEAEVEGIDFDQHGESAYDSTAGQ